MTRIPVQNPHTHKFAECVAEICVFMRFCGSHLFYDMHGTLNSLFEIKSSPIKKNGYALEWFENSIMALVILYMHLQ